MSTQRRRTPAEKKRLAYQRDYVSLAEYPHAFRRHWPRKKARVQRAERRIVRQVLRDITPKHHAEARDDMPLTPIRRAPARKWGVVALGPWVQSRLHNRIHRTAWNFFKRPYQTEHHRARFIRFLTTIMQGNGPTTRQIARFFDDILESKEVSDPRSQWLDAFFLDEPLWKERLRVWVAQYKEE